MCLFCRICYIIQMYVIDWLLLNATGTKRSPHKRQNNTISIHYRFLKDIDTAFNADDILINNMIERERHRLKNSYPIQFLICVIFFSFPISPSLSLSFYPSIVLFTISHINHNVYQSCFHFHPSMRWYGALSCYCFRML